MFDDIQGFDELVNNQVSASTGKNLGHKGLCATIQLAGAGACYVLDLEALGMRPNVRELLTGPAPLKVCHGFSNDQISLIAQYKLDFADAAIFDTQFAASLLPEGDQPAKRGVVQVLQNFTKAPARVLLELESMKEQLRFQDYFERPLPTHALRYVCLDVVFACEVAHLFCLNLRSS